MKKFKNYILISFFCSTLTIGLVSFTPYLQDASVKVKSAYLINFLKFISWPENNSSEITIGFLGESQVEDFLNKTKSIAEQKAKIQINTMHFTSSASVNNVDILFVASYKDFKKDEALISKMSNENVLVVTSRTISQPKHSCINFIVLDGKVRFEIDNNQLKKNGLKASAQLLKLSYKR